MSTTTYVKEVNNSPVIFNIDNAPDMENLEALQAIRMPENMANEIFGNNIRYADNTTCVITENPGNAEFPFNVQFDSSKIFAMPQTKRKLTDSYLAGIGMPATKKYITINIPVLSNEPHWNGTFYDAPANGWAFISAEPAAGKTCLVSVSNFSNPVIRSTALGSGGISASAGIPIKKGECIHFVTRDTSARFGYFFYAEGEI